MQSFFDTTDDETLRILTLPEEVRHFYGSYDEKTSNEKTSDEKTDNTSAILINEFNKIIKTDEEDEYDDCPTPPTLEEKKSSNVGQGFFIPFEVPDEPIEKKGPTVRVFWNLHALPIPGDIGLLNTMKRIVNSSREIAKATSVTFRLYKPRKNNHALFRTVGPPCYPTILRYCSKKKDCDDADKYITADALNFAFAYVCVLG